MAIVRVTEYKSTEAVFETYGLANSIAHFAVVQCG
jgi:hypothetical protein